MKIYQIASVFSTSLDNKYYEVAKKKLKSDRPVLEIAEEFRLDAYELGEWVIHLNRTSVDDILRIVDLNPKEILIKRIAYKVGSSVDDVAWILRRLRPNIRIHPTEEEKQKIIDLKKTGLSNLEISKKTRISEGAIWGIIKKENPDLLRTRNATPEMLDNLAIQYLYLTEEDGKTHDEAVKQLLNENHGLISHESLLKGLKRRDLTLPAQKNKKDYGARIEFVVKSLEEGKTFKEIGESLEMNPRSVMNLVRKERPDLTKGKSKPLTLTLEEEQIIKDRFEKGDKILDIARDLKRNRGTVSKIIKRDNLVRSPKDPLDFPVKDIAQEKIEVQQPKQPKQPKLSNEEVQKAEQRYQYLVNQEKKVQEQIPEYVSREREKLEEALKETGAIAQINSLNWYKVAQTPQNLEATGDCFQLAGEYMTDQCAFGDCNLILVHAIIIGQGPIEGVEHGHAWIEDGDTVFDPANNIRLPKDEYYALARIQKAVKYTFKELKRKVTEHRTWGAWDLGGSI